MGSTPQASTPNQALISEPYHPPPSSPLERFCSLMLPRPALSVLQLGPGHAAAAL